MKKQFWALAIFASLSLSLMLTSCSKSPEQKAKDLAETEIKKLLYFPESYDPADIKIDSAFSPYDSPEFMELTANLAKTGDELAEAKEEIKGKMRSVSLWSMPFDSYSRNELNEAKTELAEAKAKEKKAMEEAKKLMLKMKTLMEVKPKFIGFKAMVSYRAKNNKGNILMSNEFLMFDKDIKEVVFMCDDNEYEQHCQAIKLLQEKFEATK